MTRRLAYPAPRRAAKVGRGERFDPPAPATDVCSTVSNSQPQRPGGGPPAPGDDPLVAALRGLHRAFHKSSIYPEGHPSIPLAVREAVEGLRAALSERELVVLGIGRDRLLDGQRELGETTGAVVSLARLLHELDLAAVEFHHGVVAEEIERLVSLLGRARREQLRGQRLVDALAAEPIEHVRLGPIDYRGLAIAEGVGEQAGTGSTDDPWARLARVLTDPGAYEGSRLDDLALQITETIETREGAGLGRLRSEIQDVLRGLSSLPDGQRQMMRAQLGAFVAGMKPALRRDLLRIDPGSQRDSLRALTEICDALPLSEVLDALQEVEQSGAPMSDEVAALFTKLVRLSSTEPAERSALSAPALREWRDDDGAVIDGREALRELLQRRHADEFNREDYRQLLAELSQGRRSGGATLTSPSRYRDPEDAGDVKLHSAEVAVRLLGRADGERHRRALLDFVAHRTAFVIEREQFETVHQATVAARAHALMKSESEETRRAARAYLDSFVEGERIRSILTHACHGTSVPEDATRLLGLGGARALDAVLDMLATTDSPAIGADLRRFARDRGAELLGRVLDDRLARGCEALEPVFAVLYELPTAEAIQLLKRLIKHDDFRVRREALSILLEIDRRPGAQLRYLRRALRDRHPRVVTFAVGRLRGREGREAADLLGSFVEGGLGAPLGGGPLVRTAAQALIERDENGRERLALALVRLSRRPGLRRASNGREVAALLAAHRTIPAVRRSLSLWRMSLNRLVGTFVPRDSAEPGE